MKKSQSAYWPGEEVCEKNGTLWRRFQDDRRPLARRYVARIPGPADVKQMTQALHS